MTDPVSLATAVQQAYYKRVAHLFDMLCDGAMSDAALQRFTADLEVADQAKQAAMKIAKAAL